MESCWAHCLGNCSQKISREHIVSRSLFEGETIQVFGFPWCKDKPKEIGIASLTGKFLCTKHNSELSDVDSEGSKAFGIIREMTRLANVRQRMKPRPWNVARYTISGLLFERWFLKTLINISFGSIYPIGVSNTNAGLPSNVLVEIAFGLKSFSGHSGLFLAAREGQDLYSSDHVVFSPLIKAESYIVGGLFTFRGLRFLLNISPVWQPKRFPGLGWEDWSNSQLNYHNKHIHTYSDKYLSQVIDIKW